MTSKYQHCYSNYVNHILNNSPSKIAYSFAKGSRFQSPKKQIQAPVDKILQKNIHPDVAKKYNVQLPLQINLSPNKMLNNYLLPQNQQNRSTRKNRSPNLKSQKKRSKSKSQKIQSSLIDKYLGSETKRTQQKSQPIFQRSPLKHSNKKKQSPQKQRLRAIDLSKSNLGKKKMWEKGQDPYKKSRFPQNCLYTDPHYRYEPPILPVNYPSPDLLHEINYLKDPYNQYLKYSPYYPSYVAQNEEKFQQLLSKSRDKSTKKLNRSLSEIGQSKHHRVKTSTDVLRQMDHPSKNITIHGYYPVGTEIKPDGKYPISTYKNVPTHSFGPLSDHKSSKKTLSPHKKDKLNSKQGNMVRGVSSSNLPKSYETYQPFSQFGVVQPFKI